MATNDDVEVVTDADVRSAEQEAAEAEALVVELEERVREGDESVSPDEIDASEKLGRFARLRADATARKAERYRQAVRTKALQDLRADVRKRAPKAGDDLVAALKAVEDAARAFLSLADEHDARLDGWINTIRELRVPDGETEQGLGLNGIGQLVVTGVTFDRVNGQRKLGLLFNAGHEQGLPVRDADDTRLTGAYALLDSIGEGL